MGLVQKVLVSDRQEDLLPRWSGLWMAMGARRIPDITPLIDLYSSSTRHYHNMGHLRACLAELDSARHLAMDAPAIELALWYHDAIYDATRSDNEAQSADMATTAMKSVGVSQIRIDAVRSLILATRHATPPATADEMLIVDIDLSILGKPESEFAAYESAIRQEYAHVPDAGFRQGRQLILQQFLDRPRIYLTDWFFDRYEAQARVNLRESIEMLGAGS
jgi:predicted metal-dependent HD superfamily phosphohydrolase